MSDTNERGFTLIELIVAAVLILAFLTAALFLLRPEDYSIMRQNAQRRTAVASMVQGINRYVDEHGELPPDIPDKLTAISSVEGHYDLCKYLVPKYLKDIPLDPVVGIKSTEDGKATAARCNTGITYAAGYAIMKNKDGRVFLSAPVAETDAGVVVELPVPKR
ncbi:MAG TPA: type II secretion system protein [Candidatus Saccharimonadales bacterium]|nr:type II secretion system protein [Candidatus Saccharimonadales bacterium]